MTQSQEKMIPIPPAGFDGERPVGLYYRLQVGFLSGTRLEIRTFLFLPGSRATRVFPFGGGDLFDSSRCSADTCGSYRCDVGQIAVAWDSGQVDRLSFKRTVEGFELDGDAFKPARPVSAPALLGTWAGAGNTGNPAENIYKFERDGKFSFNVGNGGVGGRYSVKGLTLTLEFDDSDGSRRTLFAAGSSEPVGLICVDDDIYRRQ